MPCSKKKIGEDNLNIQSLAVKKDTTARIPAFLITPSNFVPSNRAVVCFAPVGWPGISYDFMVLALLPNCCFTVTLVYFAQSESTIMFLLMVFIWLYFPARAIGTFCRPFLKPLKVNRQGKHTWRSHILKVLQFICPKVSMALNVGFRAWPNI